MIMDKIRPRVEKRRKIIYALLCKIFRGQGEIVEYNRTFKTPLLETFYRLAEIEEYIQSLQTETNKFRKF